MVTLGPLAAQVVIEEIAMQINPNERDSFIFSDPMARDGYVAAVRMTIAVG